MRQKRRSTARKGVIALALLSIPFMNAMAQPAQDICHVDLLQRPQESAAQQQKTAQAIARLEKEMQSLVATLRKQIAQIRDVSVRAQKEAELQNILSRNDNGVGSPLCRAMTQESREYVREAQLRIEDCGTANFPKDEEGRSLYGQVTISFLTDENGQLVSSTLAERNDDPRINLHALRIVRASTPFGPVPSEMRSGGHVRFHYAERFTFAHTDAEPSASEKPKVRCSLGKEK